jgi:uncharacterized protein YjiS (DUF1127 family)
MQPLSSNLWTQKETALAVLQPILTAFTAWRTEQRKRAQIARELATYTDRELFDLRIQRADIPAMINGTYTR